MNDLVGLSLLWILGILVVAAGLIRMFWAFQTGSLGKGVLVSAIGGLTLLCGIALMANPLGAAGSTVRPAARAFDSSEAR